MKYKTALILSIILGIVGSLLIFCGSCALNEEREEITMQQYTLTHTEKVNVYTV